MKNTKQIIGLILSVVLSVGLVVVGVNAATTIGNNVEVGGTTFSAGNLIVNGYATTTAASGNFATLGTITTTGGLYVGGYATTTAASGNYESQGRIWSKGDIVVGVKATTTAASGNFVTAGTVFAGGNVMFNGFATTTAANGNFATEGTLTVAGTAAITGITTFGNKATAGLLLGSGASGYANAFSVGATEGTTKGMSFYLKSTSVLATDAIEGLYINTYHGNDAAVAAPSGEAARFRAYLKGDAAGTIALAGSHSTVEMETGSTNTGLTLGSRGNLVLPNGTIGTSGTFAGAQAELFAGGADTTVAGTTDTSILRLVIGGTAPTAAAQLTVPVFSISIPSNLVGNNLVVDNSSSNEAPDAKMRIKVNGTTYWILMTAVDD